MNDEVWVAWRDCNCDWTTKYCDDHHLQGATVSRSGLEALTAVPRSPDARPTHTPHGETKEERE